MHMHPAQRLATSLHSSQAGPGNLGRKRANNCYNYNDIRELVTYVRNVI
jgi:hypothetical protein